MPRNAYVYPYPVEHLQSVPRGFNIENRKELRAMNEEELKAKEDELLRKEGELQKKEEEIKAREDDLSRSQADASELAKTIKDEYEKKIEKQRQEYEARLASRNEIIKQLAAGEEKAPAQPSFIERMNEKRERQNKKW